MTKGIKIFLQNFPFERFLNVGSWKEKKVKIKQFYQLLVFEKGCINRSLLITQGQA